MVSNSGIREHATAMGRKRKERLRHPGHYLREWREFRDMTGEQLAEAIGRSPASISQLENGRQGYRQKTLEDLARALRTDPASLLGRNPFDPDGVWALADRISRAPPNARRAAIAVIDSLDPSKEPKA
jgi:transcriptional regulator with XRE-family HTH domain